MDYFCEGAARPPTSSSILCGRTPVRTLLLLLLALNASFCAGKANAGSVASPPKAPVATPPATTPSTNQTGLNGGATCAQQLDARSVALEKTINDLSAAQLGTAFAATTADVVGLAAEAVGAATAIVTSAVEAGIIAQGAAAAANLAGIGTAIAGQINNVELASLDEQARSLPSCDQQFTGTVKVSAGGANVTGDSIFNNSLAVAGQFDASGAVSANSLEASQGLSAMGGQIRLGNPDGTSHAPGITLGGGAVSGLGGSGSAPAQTGDPDAIAIGNGSMASRATSTALGTGAKAMEDNTTALGAASQATAAGATAVGSSAMATQSGASAWGHDAHATGAGSTAMGQASLANAADTTATGRGAQATDTNASAYGAGALASRAQATALGAGSQALQADTLAVGVSALATGLRSTALGVSSTASGTDSISMGNVSSALGPGAIAVGNGSQARTLDTVIGYQARATADGAFVGGARASVSSAGGVAIGFNSIVAQSAPTAIAIGAQSSVAPGAAGSIAIGRDAQAFAPRAAAYGSGAAAIATNSVALGDSTMAARPNTVSVGNLGAERQITNIAPGTSGTDAVNVNQLQAVAANAYRGVAMSAALAESAPELKPGETAGFAGVGSYRGYGAIAIGLVHVASNARLRYSIGIGATDSGGGAVVRAGISYRFSE